MADNNPNINRIYPSEVNKKNVIVFDRTSTDSVVSAAIVKYICKNVEKDTEYDSVCINILDAEKFFTNEKDYLAEGTNLNDVVDSVSFCGCIPSAQVIKKLYYIFGNKLVFFLCDEQKVGEIKKISKSIQIESSTEDSCAMILYKIVNGEILANIPDEIKYISGYRLENYDLYDLDATSVFNFEYGLKSLNNNYIVTEGDDILSDKLFADLYTYVQSLINKEPSTAIADIISAGEEIIAAEEENLLNKFNVYGSDIWSVDKDKNFKACVLLTDMNLRPEFYAVSDFDEFEYIITFYRLSNASWNVSIYEIPKEESNEEVVKVNLLKYLDKYSPSGNEKVVHFNVSAQQFTKILLAKSI